MLKNRTATASLVRCCGLLLLLATAASGQSNLPPKVATNKIKNHLGQVVTVCAKVVTYDCDDTRHSITLDLEKPYWANPLGIFISREARERFPSKLEDQYVLGDVCVTGTVERREKRHVIVVDRPDQITFTRKPSPFIYRPDAVRPCDGNVEMPKVVHEVKPIYPQRAQQARQQGAVLVEVVVGLDGRVGEGRLLVGFDPWTGLNEAALGAIQGWRFKPGTIDGKPVPVIVLLELTFALR